jgi:hypothetical protein
MLTPRRLILLLTIVFTIVIAWIVVIADIGLAPQLLNFIHSVPCGDLLGHFLLLGTLSLLVNLSTGAQTIRLAGAGVLLGSIVIAAIATLEECSQLWLEHRSFSLLDLAANYAGIILFGRLAKRLLDRGWIGRRAPITP